MLYICPMHPEIQQSTPGRCSLCGMKLVLKDEMSSDVMAHSKTHSHMKPASWKAYLPLLVIIGIILLVSGTLSYRDILMNTFSIINSISYFMVGFFLTFATFKLIDLPGFAEGYATYDILAKRWFGYGYIYPFIELFFGLSMLISPHSTTLLWAEILVMVFSGIGVSLKLARHEKFQCACLGTFLKVPLTKVTLIEDFGMAILAGILLVLS